MYDNNLCQSGMENSGMVSGTETSNAYPLVSHDLINIDCHGSDISYGDGYDRKDFEISGEEVCKINKLKQMKSFIKLWFG